MQEVDVNNTRKYVTSYLYLMHSLLHFQEDDDVDSEEYEDEEDYDDRPRKRKRKANDRYRDFIIEEAEVDTDADEDDDYEENVGEIGIVGNEVEESGQTAREIENRRRMNMLWE